MRQLILSLSLIISISTFAAKQMANVVCFVKFADQEDVEWQHPIDYYEQMFNDNDELANSVWNYFHQMSYGVLDWYSVLIPKVYTDAYPRSYYCKQSSINPDGYTNITEAAQREQILLAELCRYVEDSLPEDIQIDCNGDDKIDNFTIIYCGNSEISSSNNLWPANQPCLWTTPTLNGKKVNFYLKVFDKANGYKSLIPQELNTGVLCHEMMHTLDAPDLYSNGSLNPVGIWDLMSDNQIKPQGLTAYIRRTYGKFYGNWITKVKELTQPGRYVLRPLDSEDPTNVAYKIVPNSSKDEYFMIEYRDGSLQWDESLPNHGMLVYRIDPYRIGNLNASKFEMYIFRPEGSTQSVGKISQAPLGEDTGYLSFGTMNDEYYPYYADGSRAQFCITDVVTTDEGMEFTLSFDIAGLEEIGYEDNVPFYDNQTGRITAYGSVKTEIYNMAGSLLVMSKEEDIDLQGLKRGVYIAQIYYRSGCVKTLKFIR